MPKLGRVLLIPVAVLATGAVATKIYFRSSSTPSLPLRTLIVAGGPSLKMNQYAIASNARYLEKLTELGQDQRVLFANGNPESKSVMTFEPLPDADARKIFGWMFRTKPDFQGKPAKSTPGLKRIDGACTAGETTNSTQWLGDNLTPGTTALAYFTGHGSSDPDQAAQMRASTAPALTGTSFVLWGDGKLKPADLARDLQNFPKDSPLVLVMSQCFSGGFANLIYETANPSGKVRDWDFCGFFSVSGDRPASGCTPEIDELDYQDFTTHFFAALSGISRDGKPVKGADYDKDGQVTMLEAFAWASLTDDSIDIPTNTSDYFLRRTFPATNDKWLDTPLSEVRAKAAPWQLAVMDGLAKELELKGDKSIRNAAVLRADDMVADATQQAPELPKSLIAAQGKVSRQMDALHKDLVTRFPGLVVGPGSIPFTINRPAALEYLTSKKSELAPLVAAFDAALNAEAERDIRIAKLTRFVRVCRTIILEQELSRRGTAQQKAIFNRLRSSESRNPLAQPASGPVR